jgi:recombination protein RecA
MTSASALRNQIEASLASKIPSALSPIPRAFRLVVPSGIPPLDEVLDGGFPAGAITELVGASCSGRTTTALAYLSSLTQAGNVCAWIDVADTLDPESVAANGADLTRLLWVRCGSQPTPSPVRDSCQSLAHSHPLSTVSQRTTGGGSPHPRNKGRDIPQAIATMLRAHGGLYDKHVRRETTVGTPGAKNRTQYRSEDREEQVNSDRLPPRRGDNIAIVPRCAEPQPRRAASLPMAKCMPVNTQSQTRKPSNPWHALDQALRATDLLLQSGGFSAIILDLGNTSPETAWRIPLATWFRFRAACERTCVSLVLLTPHSCARSAAELVLRMETGSMKTENKVMTGMRYRASIERSRSCEDKRFVSIRKTPRSETGQWTSGAAWARK